LIKASCPLGDFLHRRIEAQRSKIGVLVGMAADRIAVHGDLADGLRMA
jgi:hypothetical protein